MGDIFLKILNMSIAASWLILAAALLRLALKKAPRWISVLLWGIVAVRLMVPFSFESQWSLIPSAETFSPHTIQYETPAINSGIPAVNHAVNPVLGEMFAPNPAVSVNPLYVWTFAASVIWLIGIAAMLLYAVISYGRVRRSIAERAPYKENIFLCDHVRSPFILGLIRPKIYLPSGMDASALEPVLAHEQAHLRRRDHWWKPLGFLILTVHWFNPLCWVAYVLLCRDIELACDEKVIRQMDLDGKKQYSAALLACGAQRRLVTICPLAFGELGVKERVKKVLNYKKPAFWLVAAAVIACAAVTVCFATNPKRNSFDLAIQLSAGGDERVFYTDEEVSSRSGVIEILAGQGLGDTMIQLLPVEADEETPYGKPQHMTPGMPVKFQVEKGAWFKIGIGPLQGESTEDVHIRVKNVEVRIVERIDDGPSADPTEGTDEPDKPDPEEPGLSTLSDEQAAIRQAILVEHQRSSDPTGLVFCASFKELAAVSGTPPAGSGAHKITYYGWALYEEYRVTDNGLETVTGSHVPVALSFDVDENGYTLTEYWEPRDGGYLARDIREKFPVHAAEDGVDSQKFIIQQKQECYAQAIASAGLDTEQVIGRLIETICGSPAQSSNPGDYIEQHSTEYRELIYYGRETLNYSFARFERGGETGLEGHIMMRACEDIAAGWGEEPLEFSPPGTSALTGQLWYSAFKSNALSLAERYTETELAERYPASYLLLNNNNLM